MNDANQFWYTSGELSRKEGGKIFASGSRTSIAITLLVKNPNFNTDKATIRYYDIGDYLSRDEKLTIVKNYKTVLHTSLAWKTLQPNEHGDWISQRNNVFDTFIPIAPAIKFDIKTSSFFNTYSLGINTSRDAWCYNFSENRLSKNINETIAFFNSCVSDLIKEYSISTNVNAEQFVDIDTKKISWDRGLKNQLKSGKKIEFNLKSNYISSYRPFCKQRLYFDKSLNAMLYQSYKLFPQANYSSLIICISCVGANNGLSVIITENIANLHFNGDSQCFPLYYYEARPKNNPTLFDTEVQEEYILRDGISDFILNRAQKQHGKNVSKEDIFYYIYGILHRPDYRITFANDLKKKLPRIPLVEDVKDFWTFSKAGRKLADLHINYEIVPPYDGVEVTGIETGFFDVNKMRFPSKGNKESIIFNSKITVSKIPAVAYEYNVNGKSAIEWIIERYQVTTNKDSGIKNDPNDWAVEVGKPRYILDLLLSIINVSVQTVAIVEGLPKLDCK